MNILSIENLHVEYSLRSGVVEAVHDFSLSLARGECLGLVGESGCGKSTVAMAIMRHLGPFGRIVRGRIMLEGQDLVSAGPAELQKLRGSKMAMVYQDPMSALNPSLLIGRQLREVLTYKEQLSSREANARVIETLTEVRIPDPEHALTRYPYQLSGGQQQRVVIAMALLARPSLLILDEPTTALDVTVQMAFTDLLRDLRRRYDTAMIYISHNLGVVARVCDRVGVMYLGQLVEEGSIGSVFRAPHHPYTQGLIACIPRVDVPTGRRSLDAIPGRAILTAENQTGCRFAPRCTFHVASLCSTVDIPFSSVSGEDQHRARCVRWQEIAWHRRSDSTPPLIDAPQDRAPIMRVSNVTKHYGNFQLPDFLAHFLGRDRSVVRANEDISFDVGKGATLAIVGESGSGKSTLARLIMGLEKPTNGRIQFLDVDLARLPISSRKQRVISALQMVFQNPDATLNPMHSIGYAIERAVRKLGDGRPPRDVSDHIRRLLNMVQLPADLSGRYPDQLSGGQKQRVAIARAFAGDPAMVVADEPVSALDVSVQAGIVRLLIDIQADRETSLIFISHDLGIVRMIAAHVIVVYLGQIVESGPVQRVFEPPYHPYTEALLAACPVPDPLVTQRQIPLSGETPSAIDVPIGCPFASRCHRRIGDICATVPPPAQKAEGGHSISCHIPIAELASYGPVFIPAKEPGGSDAHPPFSFS